MPAFENARDYFDAARAQFAQKDLPGWQEKEKEIESLGLLLVPLGGGLQLIDFFSMFKIDGVFWVSPPQSGRRARGYARLQRL